jgi:hypothetical protein
MAKHANVHLDICAFRELKVEALMIFVQRERACACVCVSAR